MKRALRISLLLYAVVGGIGALLWFWAPPFFEPVRLALQGGGRFAFEYPYLLLAALPILPLALYGLSGVKRKAVGTMIFTRGDILAAAPRTLKARMGWVTTVLRALGAAALVLALARPQMASTERLEAEGIDIYVVLDMSGSMQAIDLAEEEVRYLLMQGQEPLNRFEVAKDVLQQFVQRRQESPFMDRIGMVIFARHAFLQFPLTIDYQTIQWLIDRLELNDIDASQTAIGNALGRAVLGLLDSDSPSKIVILITDGDERGGNVSAMEAAEVAADEGIDVYPILVGREGPVLVPAGRSHFGFGQRYERREYPVDPELLSQVAEVTGGRFFRAENREELETTLEEIIGEYTKTAHEESIRIHRDEVFFPFVWAGFLLIGLDVLLRYTFFRKFP